MPIGAMQVLVRPGTSDNPPTLTGKSTVLVESEPGAIFGTPPSYTGGNATLNKQIWESDDGINWIDRGLYSLNDLSTHKGNGWIMTKRYLRAWNTSGGAWTLTNFYVAIAISLVALTFPNDDGFDCFADGDLVQGYDGGTQVNYTQYFTTGALGTNPNTYAFDGNLNTASSVPGQSVWEPPAGIFPWVSSDEETVVEVHTWGGASYTDTTVNGSAAQRANNGTNKEWLTFTLPAGEDLNQITNGGA